MAALPLRPGAADQTPVLESVQDARQRSLGDQGARPQLFARHPGGIAQGGQQSFQEASQEGKVEFRNAMILDNASGDSIVMGRSMKIAIIDEAGQERAIYKVSYGAKIHVKDGSTVKRGGKLFEWDPYTLPIIAEKGGVARFVDLVSGISVREDTDDATGMTQKIVSDWRSAP